MSESGVAALAGKIQNCSSPHKKQELFMQLLEDKSEGASRLKISCISSSFGEFPSLFDTTFDGILHILQTEEDIAIRIEGLRLLAIVAKEFPQHMKVITDALLQFLASDMPPEREVVDNLLEQMFYLDSEGFIEALFSSFIYSRRKSVSRNRIVRYICSRQFESKITNSSRLVELVNGYFKYALYEASIGEWESFVMVLYYINKSSSGIIRIPKEKLIDILCYPFAEENATTYKHLKPESLEKFLSITSILAKTAKEHSGLNCVVLDYASKHLYPQFFEINKKYQSPLLKAIAEISDKTDTETARRNLRPTYDLLCKLSHKPGDKIFNLTQLECIIFIFGHLGFHAGKPIELLFDTNTPPREFSQRFMGIFDFVSDHKRILDGECPPGSLNNMPEDLKNDMKGALNNLKNILNAAKNLKKQRPEFSNAGMLSWRATVVRKKMIEYSQRSRDQEIANTKNKAEKYYPLSATQNKLCDAFYSQKSASSSQASPRDSRTYSRPSGRSSGASSQSHSSDYGRRDRDSSRSTSRGRDREPHRKDVSSTIESRRRESPPPATNSWEPEPSTTNSWTTEPSPPQKSNKSADVLHTAETPPRSRNAFEEAPKMQIKEKRESPAKSDWIPEDSVEEEAPNIEIVEAPVERTLKRSPEQTQEQPPAKKFKNEAGESVPSPVKAPTPTPPSTPASSRAPPVIAPIEAPVFNKIVAPPEEPENKPKRNTWGKGQGKKPTENSNSNERSNRGKKQSNTNRKALRGGKKR